MARIPLPRQSDLPAEYQYLLSEDALGELELLQAIGSNPSVLQTYMRATGPHCGNTPDSHSREVELVILTIARELENEYEWHQHVGLARDVGVEHEEIRAIGTDRVDEFDTADSALLRYAKLAVRRTVDDEAHAEIGAHFDDETIAGIASLVGHYLGTAVVIDALSLRPETAFVGWEPDDETIETYDRDDE